MENGIQLINLSEIMINKLNPRKTFNESSITELSESIKNVGVLQPIIVRHASHAKIKYEIVCGERRYRASKMAGVETIPAIVKVLTDTDAFWLMITENLQREDVNPIEEAEAYQNMIGKMKYQVADLCIRFGKSETYIRHRLKLNDLIPEFTKMLNEEEINLSMAIEISKLSDNNQAKLYEDNFKTSAFNRPKNVKDLKSTIDRYFTLNLSDAKFSLTDDFTHAGACISCLKNTACDGILFPEEPENGRCLDKVCFEEKNIQHVISLAKIIQETEPGVIIVEQEYGNNNDKISQRFVDAGIDICKFPDEYFCTSAPSEPTKPEAPIRSDFEDDEDYEDSLNEYNIELESYNIDLQEYSKKLEEFNIKISNGNYRKALIATGYEAGKIAYLYSYSHTKNDVLKGAENSAEVNLKSEVAELQFKDKRNFEISFDKSYQQIKKLVFDYENKEAGKLIFENETGLSNNENDTLILIMTRNCGGNEFVLDILKKYGYESYYSCGDVSLEIIQKLTIAEKNRIKRAWILQQIKSTLALTKNEYDRQFIEIVKEHYPDQTNTILLDEQGKYLKKKEIINKKIEEIETKLIKSVTKK